MALCLLNWSYSWASLRVVYQLSRGYFMMGDEVAYFPHASDVGLGYQFELCVCNSGFSVQSALSFGVMAPAPYSIFQTR